MRKILFRGKRTKNGQWVTGLLWHHVDKASLIYSDELDDKVWVNPQTVGQFTGLTDKNGKKIFEGDIVEHHVQGDILVNRGVVNWDKENARWAYRLNTMNPCFALYNPKTFEVIGNIHDNPELLEVDSRGKN